MIDTLMVLWTRGAYGRALRALATFLLLFIGICVMLFLVTASGVRWAGLAVTVGPPIASPAPVATHPASAPAVSTYLLSIPKNPTVPPTKHSHWHYTRRP